MNQRSSALRAVWVAVAVQVVGVVFDAVWHGVVNPGFEPASVEQMARHLATVHLPIYLGVMAVFVATGWALIERWWRSGAGVALPVAFAGALLALVGEAWHAYTHLQLSTHAGPVAGFTALLGLTTVVVAVWLAGRRQQRGAGGARQRRRAA
jgi:FtsH-binding integral membrane protein